MRATQKTDLIIQQGVAANEAYDALKVAIEHLPLIMELVGEQTKFDAIYMLAFAATYQLSLENQYIIQRLDDIQKSIDCAGAKPHESWMTNDMALMDKARELGILTYGQSTQDLLYKVHKKLSAEK